MGTLNDLEMTLKSRSRSFALFERAENAPLARRAARVPVGGAGEKISVVYSWPPDPGVSFVGDYKSTRVPVYPCPIRRAGTGKIEPSGFDSDRESLFRNFFGCCITTSPKTTAGTSQFSNPHHSLNRTASRGGSFALWTKLAVCDCPRGCQFS